ncbi:hypothetical protein GCM10007941_28680 [Amphritea balenae]|nr:hypothetical protein GCM10007941_28680 [Amphritea balenae]
MMTRKVKTIWTGRYIKVTVLKFSGFKSPELKSPELKPTGLKPTNHDQHS